MIRSLAFAALALTVSCQRPWIERAEFQAELRCGMQPQEIADLATKHRAERHGAPEMAGKDPLSPDYYIFSGSTYYSFRFDQKGLNTVGQGHINDEGETVVDQVYHLCGPPGIDEPLFKPAATDSQATSGV